MRVSGVGCFANERELNVSWSAHSYVSIGGRVFFQ